MTNQASSSSPAKVFLSYAHADEKLMNELKKHLAALRRQSIISTWHDRDITAGSEWAGEISQELENADVILLLISADFLSSDYCWDVEMKRAMERHNEGTAVVIPIFLRPCDWKGAIFGKLQGLPTDAQPVISSAWSSQDEAFTIVAAGIRKAIVNWKKTESQPQDLSNQPTAVGYKVPKSLNTDFNAYAASRDILTSIDAELTFRMSSLEKAGYVVDHDQQEGKIRFRVLSGDRTIYFLQFWLGGLGNDKGISFFHGWGNVNLSNESTTATATPVPDDYTGEAKLKVLNMSLLGHGVVQQVYTKSDFLESLWQEIIRIVDSLGRR